jgi:uncharacterized repeat protein (TIGR04052 family)
MNRCSRVYPLCGRVIGRHSRTFSDRFPKPTQSRAERDSRHDFRFFVQEVRLLDAAGRPLAVELAERAPLQTRDVALIDFTDQRGHCSGDGTMNVELIGRAPAGETAAIEIVLGVPETLNHQNFTVAQPPLADASTYWGWTVGYRFFMAVLDIQSAAADGGTSESARSLLHVGPEGCSPTDAGGFTCTRPHRAHIRLDDFDPDPDVITADLAQVFDAWTWRRVSSVMGSHPIASSRSPRWASLPTARVRSLSTFAVQHSTRETP